MYTNELAKGFSTRQKEILNKYLLFYKSLDCGKRIPTTEAQRHFVSVCRGKSQIQTEHEDIYIKYRNNLHHRQAVILSKREERKARRRQEKPVKHKSSRRRRDPAISRDLKTSERIRISKSLLRQTKIVNALVVSSD